MADTAQHIRIKTNIIRSKTRNTMKQKLWVYKLLWPLVIIYSCSNETADYHPNISTSEHKITKEIAETKVMELVNEIGEFNLQLQMVTT